MGQSSSESPSSGWEFKIKIAANLSIVLGKLDCLRRSANFAVNYPSNLN